jgi:hypothetical protein
MRQFEGYRGNSPYICIGGWRSHIESWCYVQNGIELVAASYRYKEDPRRKWFRVFAIDKRPFLITLSLLLHSSKSKEMIMSRLLLFVSLILLWTKEVKAVRPHYTIRYRESTERESNMATATERRGFSSTAKGRSLEVSCSTLFRCVTQTIHDPISP